MSAPHTSTTSRGTSPAAALTVAFLALFTDMLTYGLAVPVLPRLAADTGTGAGAIGVLFACYAAGFFLGNPPAGRWADRAGPRRPLLVGGVGLAAATLLFAFSATFWQLVIARLLQGGAAALSWTAALALVAGATPFASRGRNMGIAVNGMIAGLLLGPPLGGLLAERLTFAAPFLLAAGLAVLTALAYLALVRATVPATDDPAGPLAVARVPGSPAVITVTLLAAATIATIEPVLPLRLTHEFGAGPDVTGGLFALTVLVGIAVNPVVGSLIGRVRAGLLIGVGVALTSLALIGIGQAASIWHVAGAMAVLGLAYAMLQTPTTVLIGLQGQRARPPALGGAYALYNLAFGAGLLLGPLLGGPLTQVLGFPTAMIAAAIAIAAAGLISATRLPTATR